MNSSYVYTGPHLAPPIGHSAIKGIAKKGNKPQVVDNIVTAKLNKVDELPYINEFYTPPVAQKSSACGVQEPAKSQKPVQASQLVSDAVDDPKKRELEDTAKTLIEKAEEWAGGVTPEQWKKYALYAGGFILAKKLVCG